MIKDINSFKDYMLSFAIFPDPAECNHYVESHYSRFVKTLEKIPSGRRQLLEIGAAPFCMTLMMKEALDLEIQVINYGSEADIHLSSQKYKREFVFPCAGINVECDLFPYQNAQFDVVVCAEVIEHLTFCPTYMLCEIHRVLKPGGLLILTTPNVLRLVYNYHNAGDLIQGRNFYDPYSGYGPYGRHNREFTPGELQTLVEGCGFAVREMEICDVPERVETKRNRLYRWILPWLFPVSKDAIRRYRGSQIFLTAQPEKECTTFLPDNLYKSTHAIDKARKVFPRIP